MGSQMLPLTEKRAGLSRGFTLIEMIVAVGIFTILMFIIVSALISMSNASRKARASRIAMDNLAAAMESISRTVRISTTYHCGCGGAYDTALACPYPTGATCLAVEPQNGDPHSSGDQVVYRLSGASIERSTDGGSTYLPLTAPELRINRLQFYVDGVVAGTNQPRMIMVVGGTAGTQGKTSTTFNLQTMVSERTPNIVIP